MLRILLDIVCIHLNGHADWVVNLHIVRVHVQVTSFFNTHSGCEANCVVISQLMSILGKGQS